MGSLNRFHQNFIESVKKDFILKESLKPLIDDAIRKTKQNGFDSPFDKEKMDIYGDMLGISIRKLIVDMSPQLQGRVAETTMAIIEKGYEKSDNNT